MPKPNFSKIYSDMRLDELAAARFKMLARGDIEEAERVLDAVPEADMRCLHPYFTNRADGLELATWQWGLVRLKAEREVWRQLALIELLRQKAHLADTQGKPARAERAEQQLLAAMAAHAKVEAIALAADAALDDLAKLGGFSADDVLRTLELERYSSTAYWPTKPDRAPDAEAVAYFVDALRHHVES